MTPPLQKMMTSQQDKPSVNEWAQKIVEIHQQNQNIAVGNVQRKLWNYYGMAKSLTGRRPFCGKVLNLANFTQYEKQNTICSSKFLKFSHTHHRLQSTTTAVVWLTFDRGRRRPSWIQKCRFKSFVSIFNDVSVQARKSGGSLWFIHLLLKCVKIKDLNPGLNLNKTKKYMM